MTEMQDEELLARWQAGDLSAGNALFARHFKELYWFFRGKLDDEAEDLTQETFAALVSGAGRFKQLSTVRTYLFAIAHRLLLKAYVRRSGNKKLDFGTVSVVDLNPSPTHIIAQKKEQRLVLAALDRIPIKSRVILELYFWAEMSAPQIAEVLDLSLPATYSRLHRAKEQLKKQVAILSESPEQMKDVFKNLENSVRDLRNLVFSPEEDKTGS